jgi:DNA-binding NarL/FixJ family response regulator
MTDKLAQIRHHLRLALKMLDELGSAALAPVPVTSQILSAREMQVLRLLRQGKANKVIAADLGVSESTVKAHIRHIMNKLGAANRTHILARWSDTMTRSG